MKKRARKLTLSRETVTQLDLQQAAGAVRTDTCQTACQVSVGGTCDTCQITCSI